MIYVLEFEFIKEENSVIALPFWELGGATSGCNLTEAVEFAADFLMAYVDDALMNNRALPEESFGHLPENDGRVIAVAVSRELCDIASMTAAEAARELGVSRARVSQLIAADLLDSWEIGGRRLVSRNSVEARKADKPLAGRPRKSAQA